MKKKCLYVFLIPSLAAALSLTQILAMDWSKTYPILTEIPGSYFYESISKNDDRGLILTAISLELSDLSSSMEHHARQFEEFNKIVGIDRQRIADLNCIVSENN